MKREEMEIFTATVKDRFSVIKEYVRNRTVLDIGCVDSRPAKEATDDRIERKCDLLFQRIVEINPKALGVDIDKLGIDILKTKGYSVECANAENMDLGRRFDVIVAGEIIEHVENPGRFLGNMMRHLNREGVLIISTPNPFYAKQTWKIWRYGQPAINEGHTCWFDPITLDQLLDRAGFEPIEGYWIQPPGDLFKTWKQHFRVYFSHSFLRIARPKA